MNANMHVAVSSFARAAVPEVSERAWERAADLELRYRKATMPDAAERLANCDATLWNIGVPI